VRYDDVSFCDDDAQYAYPGTGYPGRGRFLPGTRILCISAVVVFAKIIHTRYPVPGYCASSSGTTTGTNKNGCTTYDDVSLALF
jgi:hypothetical protein